MPDKLMRATPGPYAVFVGNANGRGLIRIETDLEAPEAGIHLASMPRGSVSESNAHLLAASWEMYQALKAIFEDNCFYHKDGDERAYRMATEAMRKAEGNA